MKASIIVFICVPYYVGTGPDRMSEDLQIVCNAKIFWFLRLPERSVIEHFVFNWKEIQINWEKLF